MMIIIGYTVTFAYVFFLIFPLGNFIQRNTDTETSRKIIHTMLFMVWVFIDIFFKNTVHQVIIPIIFLILNSLSYRYKIYKSVERDEKNHYGTIYFALAITIVMALALWESDFYFPSGVAAFCLTIGDGVAAIVGYNIRSPKINGDKSAAGSFACFIASILALLCFKMVYWFKLGTVDIIVLAAITAIAELTEGGLDNLTITFGVFGASYLLSVLEHPTVCASIAWAVVVFMIVFFSHAIDYRGSLLAMGIVFVFRYYGGHVGLLWLLATYFSVFLIAVVRKYVLASQRCANSAGRSFFQILINGGLGSICMILYGLTGELWLFALSLTAIGGCYIDSISSDVGSMARIKPYDFLRKRVVEPGISGGVTMLGTISAVVFSMAIVAFAYFVANFSIGISVLIGFLAFSQTVVDTILGSLLQAKYRCSVCGKETESKIHCEVASVCTNGIEWIDNNAVNLISSVIITSFAALLLNRYI